MPAPVHRLTKDEIVWLSSHKCEHHHNYLDHYACFLKEKPDQQRIGFFDIETSNLHADFGIIFSYAIKDASSRDIYSTTVNKDDLWESLDKNVIKNCVQDLSKFDKIITYYGTGFDIPYIRTRALMHNLDFPSFGAIKHHDVYYIIKSKFRLSRNRQENACRALLGSTQKTHIENIYWLRALQGDRKSIDYIHDHNIKDVLDLEKLYYRVLDYVKGVNKSI